MRRVLHWPLLSGSHTQEPGAAMFQGLRLRLTLWYTLVLGLALVLFGTALYISVQQVIFTSVNADLARAANMRLIQLQHSPDGLFPPSNFGNGSPPDGGQGRYTMTVCFDQNGMLIPADSNSSQLPTVFLSNTLAKQTLQSGQSETDVVNAGGTIGHIYRYTMPGIVTDAQGNNHLVVIQTGEVVEAQTNALQVLLALLLIVGSISLFGAGIGGLFLAGRALAPARLAFTRQQQFIADASHELRTPLTLLRADAEVLLRGRNALAEEDAALLEDIVAETNHMSMLATNMLTLARLDSGGNGNGEQHREHDVVDLADVADAMVRRANALAEQRNITLQVEHTQEPLIIGDRALLEQAVLVLLDNAIKYNHADGHVLIRTAVKDDSALLEVLDTGIGIAQEHLPHLGERFYRVDKARSREAGGTGLGLSIAHGIAAMHGGTLIVTSVLNEGTSVTLRLPLAKHMQANAINHEDELIQSETRITAPAE